MEDTRPEEKAPLLLYLSDSEGNNPSKNNKRFRFEKGRLYGISSGATAVFTEFPNLVSTCWLATILSGLVLFMMFLFMMSSMTHNANYIRVPRCTRKNSSVFDNSTIHLVHDATEWSDNEIELLERIIKKFPGFTLYVLELNVLSSSTLMPVTVNKQSEFKIVTYLQTPLTSTNQTSPLNITNSSNMGEMPNLQSTRKILMYKPLKRIKRRRSDEYFSFGVKRLLDMLLHNSKSSFGINGSIADAHFPTELSTEKSKPRYAEDFPLLYPNVVLEKMSYKEVFQRTPLEKTWPRLNSDLMLFAVRILQLWQYGGLSFHIADKSDTNAEIKTISYYFSVPKNASAELSSQLPEYTKQMTLNRIKDFIDTGLKAFGNMSKEVVTTDEDGLHIFSKIPCHAFFGEILLKLKHAKETDSIRDIMREALTVFCQNSASRMQYCQSIVQKSKRQ